MLRAACLFTLLTAGAGPMYSQPDSPYQPPRTEHGFADLQGVWWTGFVTLTERPDSIDFLVVAPDSAVGVAAAIQSRFTAGNTDPGFLWEGVLPLAEVNGEYRSSLITRPGNGKIPFSETGLALAWAEARVLNGGFDHPEQRPLSERCLSGALASPPMFTLPARVARLFVQTEAHLVIYTEDAVGLRIINIDGTDSSPAMWQFEGNAVARWQGDTLVVTSTGFRHDYPARFGIPLPMVVGANTEVVERFTRVAADRLHYAFTVNDPELYSESWQGEYELGLGDGSFYVYECHEGNYSMVGALRGGRVQSLDAERETAPR